MCQIWGGFEFDENPMYIYQYSDMVDNMDNFMAGVVFSCKPIPTQELALEVSNANNNKFSTEYGSNPVSLEKDGILQLEASKNPLTYIANWNGSFFDNKLLTRWSWGIQTQAQHKYSRMLVLGQQLNLPNIQLYFDYMGALDGLDRFEDCIERSYGSARTPGRVIFQRCPLQLIHHKDELAVCSSVELNAER